MTRINIEIPDELHKKVKIICAMKQTTIKEFINNILNNMLKSKGKNI